MNHDTPGANDAASFALTQYAAATGCSCKIAPAVLKEMIGSDADSFTDERLLVGNRDNDDAAVYLLDDGTALISTTDFFTPIVDDAYDFGRIAAANAISDVYAMGGTPLMAIAVLGWPVDKLPAALAQQVIEGGKATCREAGIVLAGGHSINTIEPFFGLAVNGRVTPGQLKRNNTARAGDLLLLTKPLGSGILATAQKRKVIEEAHQAVLLEQLLQLNKVGAALGALPGVSAMTDVTGFGLLGHLIEMAGGSGLSATLYYGKVPVLEAAKIYAAQRIGPDATFRNWNSYSAQTSFGPGVNVMEAFSILPDPQTNGGLLIAVDPAELGNVQQVLREAGLEAHTEPIGVLQEAGEKIVVVVE